MMSHNRTTMLSFFRSAYPWLIVLCGMIFYCYNYFLRVSPSVMQPELTQAFHIDASQFGILAAFYYYAYVPMQIPAGLLYDKFGVRIVLCAACLLATIGLSLFINAHSLPSASLGRFLIGLGSAFAYIGTLKLASLWLPNNRFATAAGLATAIGMTSGALSQKYLTHVIETIGYKAALHSAVIAGIALTITLFILVRNQPKSVLGRVSDMQSPMNARQLFDALRFIFSNRQMWLIGIIGCLLYLPASVFLDLWGIPYLEAAHHLSAADAVMVSSYAFYGWIISGPVIGALSDKIHRRCLPLTITSGFAILFWCIIFYTPYLNVSNLALIFFIVGFCCGAHPLCFALGKENNPAQISGTAVAVTNMLIMLGGMIFQPAVGKLLDLHRSGALGSDGLPIYSGSDYTFALSIVPIGVAIGIILSVFVKETYCQSQTDEISPVEISGKLQTEASSPQI